MNLATGTGGIRMELACAPSQRATLALAPLGRLAPPISRMRGRRGFCEKLKAGNGGAKRDRTADLLHAMQALSQLSYGPNFAAPLVWSRAAGS